MQRRTFIQIGVMLLGSTQLGLELLERPQTTPIGSSLAEMLKVVYDKGAIETLQRIESFQMETATTMRKPNAWVKIQSLENVT